jgi:hypothetical protein
LHYRRSSGCPKHLEGLPSLVSERHTHLVHQNSPTIVKLQRPTRALLARAKWLLSSSSGRRSADRQPTCPSPVSLSRRHGRSRRTGLGPRHIAAEPLHRVLSVRHAAPAVIHPWRRTTILPGVIPSLLPPPGRAAILGATWGSVLLSRYGMFTISVKVSGDSIGVVRAVLPCRRRSPTSTGNRIGAG